MRGNKSRILGALLLVALLTGCEGLPLQLPFFTAAQTTQPESQTKASEAPAATAQQPKAGPAETETEAQTGPETAALPPPPAIDDDPARILGLGPDRLTELLGRPELTRREPPAEIWQYRGESCVFDVFLYEEGGLARVTYLEARDASAQRVAERGCLNQLLRARLAEPLS
ncbi:MAG: hypothetical protein V3S27_03195 [Kiloniellales bacterium]